MTTVHQTALILLGKEAWSSGGSEEVGYQYRVKKKGCTQGPSEERRKDPITLFSSLSKPRTPRRACSHRFPGPAPSLPDSADLGGAWEGALLTCSLVMLPAQGPHLESHRLISQCGRTDLGRDFKKKNRTSR